MLKNTRWMSIIFQIAALILALLFTTIILISTGAPPLQAYVYIVKGAVSSLDRISKVIVSWIPLLLTTSGLLITFSTGLWNIGVEGQIVLGAISTTWMLRLLQNSNLPAGLIIVVSILAGMLGGAFWAGLVGALKLLGV